MQHKSFVTLWDAIEMHLKENNLNLETFQKKGKNPFPVSPRTICSIKKTAEENDGKGYQKKKLIGLVKFLGLSHTFDGSLLVIWDKPPSKDRPNFYNSLATDAFGNPIGQ